jgi:hypothetical protein
MDKRIELIRDIAFVIAGATLLVGATYNMSSVKTFIARSEKGPGVVIATPHGGAHPVIRFAVPPSASAESGTITYTQGGMGIWGYAVGALVIVRYDPEAPHLHPCINTRWALWGNTIFLYLFATPFLLIPLYRLGRFLVRRPRGT